MDDCALCVSGGYCPSGSTESLDCPRGYYCVTGEILDGDHMVSVRAFAMLFSAHCSVGQLMFVAFHGPCKALRTAGSA